MNKDTKEVLSNIIPNKDKETGKTGFIKFDTIGSKEGKVPIKIKELIEKKDSKTGETILHNPDQEDPHQDIIKKLDKEGYEIFIDKNTHSQITNIIHTIDPKQGKTNIIK